jgi:addiction module RelE/StbE family toxin
MAKIRYSKAALLDLEQIGDYISEKLRSSAAALNTVDKIQDAIGKLAGFPQMGAPLSARYADVGDYRYLICGNYLAFYREQTDDVRIDRILYGKRDYLKILFDNLPGNFEDDTE